MHSRDATESIACLLGAGQEAGVETAETFFEVAMPQRESDEFDALEQQFPQGISAGQIVGSFTAQGERLTEATFRKYVQLGLLPRSRRVGEKGKHRGSHGLYPAAAVRRIHLIKSLMDEGMTLEDIRRSFIFFRGQLDGVERSLDELFAALDKSLGERPEMGPSRRKQLERLLEGSRKQAAEFVKDIERTVTEITAKDEPGKG